MAVAPIAALAITAIGTGVSVYGQMSAASAQGKQASYYEQMAALYDQQAAQIAENAKNERFWYEQNAKQLELQAEAYGLVGEFNKQAAQLDILGVQSAALDAATKGLEKASEVQGAQTAKFAAGGVEVSSGTPLTVLSDTARKAEEYVADVYAARDLEVAKLTLSGDIAAFQAGMQGQSALFNAAGQRYAGYQAEQEGKWRAWEAKMDGWRGLNDAKFAQMRAATTRTAAIGSLLTEVGSKAGSLYSPASTMPKNNSYYFG